VLRFEADSQKILEKIQAKFRVWLKNNGVSVKDF
jgi:hypothetical protein